MIFYQRCFIYRSLVGDVLTVYQSIVDMNAENALFFIAKKEPPGCVGLYNEPGRRMTRDAYN